METFASHCFRCDEWGHSTVECQHHSPLALEVPNEGNGKKGVRRDVVVVIDEGTSSSASTWDILRSMERGLDHGKIELGFSQFYEIGIWCKK